MAETPNDKHGFWAKTLLGLYRLAAKEVKSRAGRVNILMVIGLIAIILVYILANTTASVFRIVAAIFRPEFINQTSDNIVTLILAFLIPTALCLLFMRFIIKEEESSK